MSVNETEETLFKLSVPSGYCEEKRLDIYITRFMANATRSKVQKGIKEGRVTINGEIIKKVSHKVQAGDEIICRLNRPPPVVAEPENLPVDVVYEDAYLLVVNKEAGMVVHPAYGNRTGTLVNALLYYLGGPTLTYDPERDAGQQEIGLSTHQAEARGAEGIDLRPGIVHRLDKDTSGLLVVAKDDVTHSALARQFYDRKTRRLYEALVWGIPDEKTGRIESFLGRDPRDRKKMAVVSEDRGKRAVTNYTLLESLGRLSRLEFKLETGRTHQIRVHAAQIQHPIFGDSLYGGDTLRYGSKTGTAKAFYTNLIKAIGRQALHAKTLGFRHPHTGEELNFSTELPSDMQYVIARLKKANVD